MRSFFSSFQQMWVFDEEIGMNQREITYVPGLYKIFDEILGKGVHAVQLSTRILMTPSVSRSVCCRNVCGNRFLSAILCLHYL